MIGLIGAMEQEVCKIREEMNINQTKVISGITYNIGTIKDIPCVLAKCGVGKVAAAMCTQTMIVCFSTDRIINFGVAGGLTPTLNIGDLVIGNSAVQYDMDTSAIGDPVGLISGINLISLPVDKKLLRIAVECAENYYPAQVEDGIIATGDQFVADKKKLMQIKNQFNASACDMEGGAIAQVCYLNEVPFLLVRAISDKADDNSPIDFEKFTEESSNRIKKFLPILIKEIV